MPGLDSWRHNLKLNMNGGTETGTHLDSTAGRSPLDNGSGSAGQRTCLAGNPYQDPRPILGITDVSRATHPWSASGRTAFVP